MAKNVKVILRKEVRNLGMPGDTVEVKAGYARNFLIPQGEAFAWSEKAGKQIEQMQRARRAQALANREDAVAAKAAIEGKVVEISAKVSESGKLFGASAPRRSPRHWPVPWSKPVPWKPAASLWRTSRPQANIPLP